MDIEYDVKAIPIDENYQAELDKLQKEGWQPAPGAKPIAIWHLARAKRVPMAGGAGFGDLKVDDSKIMILKPDGTLQ